MRIFVLFMMFFSVAASAGMEQFVREYTYNASENDSKVSARKAAMQQLQVLLIQEVGVKVRSSFEVDDTISNDVLSREVKANYSTFAQALTKTKILEERWNGETFYLKAQVTVDTDSLIEQIQMVYVGAVEFPTSGDVCKNLSKKVIHLLENAHRKEPIEEAIAIALKYPIDEECHRWQFNIMNQFRSLSIHDDEYRQYLFDSIKNEQTSLVEGLVDEVLRYAIRVKPISEAEWQIITEALGRSQKRVVNIVISYLVNGTRVQNDEKFSKISKLSNAKRQSQQTLTTQLDDLLTLTELGDIGVEERANVSTVASSIIMQLASYQPELVSRYYLRMKESLAEEDHQRIASSLSKYYFKQPDSERLNVLTTYFEHMTLSQRENRTLYGIFQRLKRDKKSPAESQAALDALIHVDKEKSALIIAQARTNQKEKNLWFITYKLPDSPACPIKVCADMLFDENKRVRQDGAQYLVAYGKRAEPIKAQVIKKLTRIRAVTKFEEPLTVTPALLKVLDQIQARDEASIDLMIWGLGGIGKKTQKQAMANLTHIGAEALPQMMNTYEQIKPVAQRRMVDVIGTFKTDQAKADHFLKTLVPENDYIRFAIEDARELLAQPKS